MLDILPVIAAISLIILGAVYIIPKWVTLSVEAENNPDHLYSIFLEESGYRGQKVGSAAVALSPFVIISQPINDLEGTLLMSLISIVGLIYHSTVYRGYPVLGRKMLAALASLLASLFALSVLTRSGHFPDSLFYLVLLISGFAWGGLAVYRRSALIQEERLSGQA